MTEADGLEMVRHVFPGAQPVVSLADFTRAVIHVDELGGTITTGPDGVLVRVPGGVPTDLRFLLGAHLLLLHAVARGRAGKMPKGETGGSRHELGVCTVCSEPSLVAITRGRLSGAKWPYCRITPGCTGQHRPA